MTGFKLLPCSLIVSMCWALSSHATVFQEQVAGAQWPVNRVREY